MDQRDNRFYREHIDIVTRARAYVAANAAESGADTLIVELADTLDRLRLLMWSNEQRLSEALRGHGLILVASPVGNLSVESDLEP